jgi:alpha-glucosidase
MLYTEQPNAQERLEGFVDLCAEHRIPCDLFHMSSGYTTDSESRRNVFTWNVGRVPDARSMVQKFRNAGTHLAANVKPYLLETHPLFAEASAAGVFVCDVDGVTPLRVPLVRDAGACCATFSRQQTPSGVAVHLLLVTVALLTSHLHMATIGGV